MDENRQINKQQDNRDIKERMNKQINEKKVSEWANESQKMYKMYNKNKTSK